MNTNRPYTKRWWKDTNKRTQIPGLARLGLILAVLQCPLPTGLAKNIVTNCTDTGPSLPLPKRILSACPTLGVPSFDVFSDVLVDPVTGGLPIQIWHNGELNGGLSYQGICKTDGTGAFQWKFGLTNANIWYPFADVNLDVHGFAAVQTRDLVSGPAALLGFYSDSGGTPAPVFEKQLPIDNYERVSMARSDSGIIVVALDKTNSVVLLGLNTSGGVMWAKEFSSSEFPIVSSPDTPPHQVVVGELAAGDFLLQVAATETLNGTNTAKFIIARFNSAGTIQWTRKVQLPLFMEEENPYGYATWETPAGDFLIFIPDVQTVGFFHLTGLANVIRLDSSGSLLWAKQLEGVTFVTHRPLFIDNADSSLLGLASFDFSLFSFDQHNIFAVMDASGNLTSSARVDLPNSALALPSGFSPEANKIYYHGSYANDGSEEESYTSVIASSTLNLTGFSWRRYDNGPVALGSTVLARLVDGRLLFTADDENGQWSDLVMLNSNLVTQGQCELFSAASFPVTTPSLPMHNITPTVAGISLQANNLSITLPAADLVFENLAYAEQDLCSSTCAYAISRTNVFFGLSGGSNTVSITVGSGTNCPWTVNNPCASWISVSPTSGNGNGAVTINVNSNSTGAFRSCELIIAGRTFSVGQSAVGKLPFRLLAGTGSGGANPFSLVELMTDPVEEVLIGNAGYVPKLDFAPDGRLVGSSGTSFYLVDPKAGTKQNLGLLRDANGDYVNPFGIAFSPIGVLYTVVARLGFPYTNILYTVDLDTMHATEVGRDTNGPAWGIDFTLDGRLFAGYSLLYEIDPSTGKSLTSIGTLPIGMVDIDLAPDGFIYAVRYSNRTLYRINHSTAQTEIVGVYDSELWGIASEPSFTPSIQVISSANAIILSWPATATNYTLRYATGLPATMWTTVPTPPTQVGDQLVVTNPITPGARFFQLQNP